MEPEGSSPHSQAPATRHLFSYYILLRFLKKINALKFFKTYILYRPTFFTIW
jgi:hypothetical protein